MKKKEFEKVTKYQTNCIKEYAGVLIANVGFHEGKEWKVVDTRDFAKVADRSYQPIASFHYRDELWDFIKTV